MSEKVFLNDKLVDIDRAQVSVRDSGLLYGVGLFETMRSCNGVVFSLADHLDRLFFSAQSLNININYTKEQVADAVYQTLIANGLSDARLRLTVTGGTMSEEEQQRKSTLLVTATQFHPYPEQYYQKGATVILSSFKQNPSDPVSGHKSINYLPRMLALDMARQKAATEALWFTVDNRLAEGCISNVFLVKSSIVYTPPIETPVLAGVARKAVCQIAINNSIKLIEKNLFISDLLEADEVFLTNVIMQILPVTNIEAHKVGDGKVGAVTKKLAGLFDDFVRQNCGRKPNKKKTKSKRRKTAKK
jgi:branched-chain amino acid aminotransferase